MYLLSLCNILCNKLYKLFKNFLNFRSFINRFKSWADIINHIKQRELNFQEIIPLMAELKVAAKILAGDQPDDVIEDAAVLSLRMFLDQVHFT